MYVYGQYCLCKPIIFYVDKDKENFYKAEENIMFYRDMLKKFALPVFPRTSVEKYLAEKAAAHTITWFDAAISSGILLDLVLSLVDSATRWWYIGVVEVVLLLYLLALLFVQYKAQSLRSLLGRLLLACFIAGVCELFTDASGEYVVHSLIYPQGEPMLWASPIYMPFSWTIVLTLLGYIAWRLRVLLGWRKAALLSGIAGIIYIPAYEEMAYYGGWWRYKPTHLMLGHTPIYVLLFEGLIAAALVLLYDRIERRSWPHVALIGLALGAWIPVAALLSWLLLGL